MANEKISAMPAMTTPLGGSEIFTGLQGGVNSATTADAIAAKAPIPAAADLLGSDGTGFLTLAVGTGLDLTGGTLSADSQVPSTADLLGSNGTSFVETTVGAGLTLAANVLTGVPAVVTDSTTARTLSDADNSKTLVFTNAGAVTLTVPAGLLHPFQCLIIADGTAGAVTPTASGTTIHAKGGATVTDGQYSIAALVSISSNNYRFSGSIA